MHMMRLWICNPVNPVWSVDCLLLKLLLIPNHIFIIHIDTKTAINPGPTAVHTEIELPHLLFLQPSFRYVCIKSLSKKFVASHIYFLSCFYDNISFTKIFYYPQYILLYRIISPPVSFFCHDSSILQRTFPLFSFILRVIYY